LRFSLQDIKKSVRRQQDELTISLHFLQKDALTDEIARLIVYYERLLGQPQRQFSVDDARACVGDYRMAHCLLATMSHWYSWRQREWIEVLQGLNGQPELAAITSPIQLRLALYDFVNEHYAGFLDAQTREEALHLFAEIHALNVQDVAYLHRHRHTRWLHSTINGRSRQHSSMRQVCAFLSTATHSAQINLHHQLAWGR